MAFENFQEVWAALGRLHDSILAGSEQHKAAVKKIDEQLAQLAATAMRHEERFDAMTERVDRVVSTVATIARTVGQLATTVKSHERRLGRLEGQ